MQTHSHCAQQILQLEQEPQPCCSGCPASCTCVCRSLWAASWPAPASAGPARPPGLGPPREPGRARELRSSASSWPCAASRRAICAWHVALGCFKRAQQPQQSARDLKHRQHCRPVQLHASRHCRRLGARRMPRCRVGRQERPEGRCRRVRAPQSSHAPARRWSAGSGGGRERRPLPARARGAAPRPPARATARPRPPRSRPPLQAAAAHRTCTRAVPCVASHVCARIRCASSGRPSSGVVHQQGRGWLDTCGCHSLSTSRIRKPKRLKPGRRGGAGAPAEGQARASSLQASAQPAGLARLCCRARLCSRQAGFHGLHAAALQLSVMLTVPLGCSSSMSTHTRIAHELHRQACALHMSPWLHGRYEAGRLT